MRRLVIAGHSLGAMRSANMAGLLARAGLTASDYIGFGEPRPGYNSLTTLLASAGVKAQPISSGNAHGHDLITDIPWTLPGIPYCHSGELLHAEAEPTGSALDAFRYHYMTVYIGAQLPNPLANAVAVMCSEVYKPNGGDLDWLHFYDDKEPHGICYGIYRCEDTDYIIFRGSQSLLDWFRDFDHFAIPIHDPILGYVHPGGIVGLHELATDIIKIIS